VPDVVPHFVLGTEHVVAHPLILIEGVEVKEEIEAGSVDLLVTPGPYGPPMIRRVPETGEGLGRLDVIRLGRVAEETVRILVNPPSHLNGHVLSVAGAEGLDSGRRGRIPEWAGLDGIGAAVPNGRDEPFQCLRREFLDAQLTRHVSIPPSPSSRNVMCLYLEVSPCLWTELLVAREAERVLQNGLAPLSMASSTVNIPVQNLTPVTVDWEIQEVFPGRRDFGSHHAWLTTAEPICLLVQRPFWALAHHQGPHGLERVSRHSYFSIQNQSLRVE